MEIIKISAENAEYQVIQALKSNRQKRSKLGEVFIEGIEPVKQALGAKAAISRFICHGYEGLSDWAKSVIARSEGARLLELRRDLYEALCDKAEPSELVATARARPLALGELSLPEKPFVAIFDRPSDHGNFGSIVRSANAFGADAVIVVGHGIDPFEPKVIRSSLGSVFRSRIAAAASMAELGEWLALQRRRSGLAVVGTDSRGEVSLADGPLKRPVALILGNEAKGISVALRELCDHVCRIPISGDVDSLNVACAGTVLFWDVYRNGLRT